MRQQRSVAMWREAPSGGRILALAALAALALMVLGGLAAPGHAAAAHALTAAQSSGSQPHLAATAQPTNGAFSQPTVGASTPVAPISDPSLGSSGLAIATILGCISGVLGLIIGVAALIALVRGGYGPFLRTLLPGAKRRARKAAARARSRRSSSRSFDRDGRDVDAPAPRRTGAPSSRTAGPRRR